MYILIGLFFVIFIFSLVLLARGDNHSIISYVYRWYVSIATLLGLVFLFDSKNGFYFSLYYLCFIIFTIAIAFYVDKSCLVKNYGVRFKSSALTISRVSPSIIFLYCLFFYCVYVKISNGLFFSGGATYEKVSVLDPVASFTLQISRSLEFVAFAVSLIILTFRKRFKRLVLITALIAIFMSLFLSFFAGRRIFAELIIVTVFLLGILSNKNNFFNVRFISFAVFALAMGFLFAVTRTFYLSEGAHLNNDISFSSLLLSLVTSGDLSSYFASDKINLYLDGSLERANVLNPPFEVYSALDYIDPMYGLASVRALLELIPGILFPQKLHYLGDLRLEQITQVHFRIPLHDSAGSLLYYGLVDLGVMYFFLGPFFFLISIIILIILSRYISSPICFLIFSFVLFHLIFAFEIDLQELFGAFRWLVVLILLSLVERFASNLFRN